MYNGYWPAAPFNNIFEVTGEDGARAFQMGPNSRGVLMDAHDPIIYLVQSDGAGYKTIIPYDITPHKQEPPVDLRSLEARLTSLEEKLNAKSNSRTNKKQSTTDATVEQ